MARRDLAIILGIVLIWGSNFTVMKFGLAEMPPFLFVALRFMVVALPFVAFVPRPKLALWKLLAIGMLVGTGQFALLFWAMNADITAGLASLILQAQVPFTILLSAVLLGERFLPVHAFGIGVAMVGFVLFAADIGGNVTLLGLVLVLLAALSWALGNVVLKTAQGVDAFALMVWWGLVPVVPMLALSYGFETDAPWQVVTAMSWRGWVALFYVAIVSTVIGYSLWGRMLARYRATEVMPFALLIPVVGISVGGLVLGEGLSLREVFAGALVLIGLGLTVLGPRMIGRHAPPQGAR